jgi:hypothetical protein
MTPSALPDRPNLEQLKKQAKTLLHAAQAHDAAALRRFAVLPALAQKSDAELAAVDLALHDAQSVIAREHGFASWSALREEVEARTLSFDAAVDQFIRDATGGVARRAERTQPPRDRHQAIQARGVTLVHARVADIEERLPVLRSARFLDELRTIL